MDNITHFWTTINISVTISIVGLIITLYKMLTEQKKYHRVKYDQEKRLEYKLRIHEILLDDILSFDDIVKILSSQKPLDNDIDKVEVRKCIYEMLTESTLVSFQDGTYTVDTVDTSEENE